MSPIDRILAFFGPLPPFLTFCLLFQSPSMALHSEVVYDMKDVWSNIQAVVGVAGVPSVCVCVCLCVCVCVCAGRFSVT